MNWIEKIRNKTPEQKIRLIWIVVIIAVVILVGLWILSAKFSKVAPKDTTLFDTIGQGIKDVQTNLKIKK